MIRDVDAIRSFKQGTNYCFLWRLLSIFILFSYFFKWAFVFLESVGLKLLI
jgi:hypothetical protein